MLAICSAQLKGTEHYHPEEKEAGELTPGAPLSVKWQIPVMEKSVITTNGCQSPLESGKQRARLINEEAVCLSVPFN